MLDYQDVYKQIITGNESWIYSYDLETTDKSSEYRLKGEAKPKKTSPKSLENQGDADSFLRLSWCCALRIPSNWPNCQQEILFKRYASLAWSYSQKETGIMAIRAIMDFAPR